MLKTLDLLTKELMENLLLTVLTVFTSSFVMIWVIVKLSKSRGWFVNEADLNGVQKFHHVPVSRIGGLPIFIAWSIAVFLMDDQSGFIFKIWLSSSPVFIVGLYEDLSARVSPLVRLISAFSSIVIAYFWLNAGIHSLGFESIDYLLSNYVIISLLFTLLVVGGAVNSLNIIDGFNGLLGGYSIFTFLAMAFVANTLGDQMILQLSLISAASIFGFFVLNFPFGKIFMGDGGAYFLGFMLAIIGLMLVDRNKEMSNWFVLLIFIYPMYELLYSIYRRKVIHKTDASQPDASHLHSLVYRKLISCNLFKHNKVICNSMTAPVMWLLSLIGIVPAIIWYDNQTMLIISAFVFMFIYTIIYKYISSDRFKFNH
jgi:UDP-N-acetylmuramyl pentapeptide phosphotransferase/UDP-N-acetylglucosamine-1-phosphate transferase